MATSTTNISNVSLTVSGNTTKTATISWSLPSIPSGSTISSCTLTGTATASMSKGNATIKVNGTTVSSGSSFTINLGTGNTTSSVTATARGGNKNAKGTVTFSNLKYNVTYTEPLVTYTVTFKDWDGTVLKTQSVTSGSSATAPTSPSREGYKFTGWSVDFSNVTSNITTTAQYVIWETLTIKENGAWTNIGQVFRKINGTWIEENNNQWNSIFNINTKYIKASFSPTAYLYNDGTLIFSNHSDIDNSHGNVIATYTGWDTETYTSAIRPWYNDLNLITSVFLNDISVQNTRYWFYGCSNLKSVGGSGLYNTTDMSMMFGDCSNLESVDVSNFNTKNVTNMAYMFGQCRALTSLDLSGFDTSNVTDMSSMFYQCVTLTSINVSSFNTSNVTNMRQMFYATKCSMLDLTSFDFTNVEIMSNFITSDSTIYVKDQTSKSKIESMGNLLSGTTVIIGSPT